MKFKLLATLITLLFFSSVTINAQGFLKKLKNATVDKIANKAANKLAEDMANAAMRPISNMSEELFKARYKEQYGKDWDDDEFENDEERREAMQKMMSTMFAPVDLPPSYEFDYKMTIETRDYGKKKSDEIVMLISTSKQIFGFEQEQNGDKNSLVFDYEGDIMATYNYDEKTVVGMSGLKSMSQYGVHYANKEIEDHKMEIEQLSKTKKILDCTCKGVKVKDDESQSEIYFCNDLPFSWEQTFMGAMAKMSPGFHDQKKSYDVEGFMYYAKSKRNKDKKESEWEVTDISDQSVIIDNSDFEKVDIRM